MSKERTFQRPGGLTFRNAAATCLIERVHDFAEDIQLKLAMRGIADTYRSRFLISLEPRYFPFPKSPFSTDTVHDLQLLWTARNGTKQPVAPTAGFLEIFRAHQSKQRQSSVAHPTESVIPISMTANH